jgi:hypothetical protein
MQLLLILAVLAQHIWTVYSFRFSQKLQRELGSGGEETLLRIKILNPRPLPIALMEIDVSTADPCGKTGLTFSLPPFGEKRFDIPITMPYCEMYDIGMAKSYLTDIFGLTPPPLRYAKAVFITVNPAYGLSGRRASLLVTPLLCWTKSFISSSYLRLCRGRRQRYLGLRQYRQGDSCQGRNTL